MQYGSCLIIIALDQRLASIPEIVWPKTSAKYCRKLLEEA